MDKNDELQKKARKGELAIKGTLVPDVTTEPVAPAKPQTYVPDLTDPEALERWRRGPVDQPDEH